MQPINRHSIALLLALAALPAGAEARARHHPTTVHHRAAARPERSRHQASHHDARHPARARSAHDNPARGAAAAPAGASRVPAGGQKLYCAGRSSPLLVRKMTQGNGTTVTVICR